MVCLLGVGYSIEMGKFKAHIVLSLFDIMAIFVCYHVVREWNRVSGSVLLSEYSIGVQKPLGLYILLLVIPFMHFSSLINIPVSYKKATSYVLVGIFLLMIILSFYIDYRIDNILTNADYSYCQQKSEGMRFSEFKVFVTDDGQCIE